MTSPIDRNIWRVLPSVIGRAVYGLSGQDGCRNCVANVDGWCAAADERARTSEIKDGWCILWERFAP